MATARSRTSKLFIVGAMLCCCAGGVLLLMRNMQRGSSYPVYSTYRSDPLGCKVWMRALDALPGVTCRRSHVPIPNLTETPTVLFYLGTEAATLQDEKAAKALQQLARAGHRVVIGLYPGLDPIGDGATSARPRPVRRGPVGQPAPAVTPQPAIKAESTDCRTSWGITITSQSPAPTSTTCVLSDTSLPDLPWHSSLILEEMTDDWGVIFESDENTTIARRQFGQGEVIVCTDSYWASNESTYLAPSTDFMAWLCRDRDTVVFDEYHHGLRSQEGIGTLIKRYRLHGFLAGLLLLGALYCRRVSCTFMPRMDDEELMALRHVREGRDSMSGIVSLLRRNIELPSLLSTCVDVWKGSLGRTRRVSDARLHEITGLAGLPTARSGHEENIIETYEAIRKILEEEKRL